MSVIGSNILAGASGQGGGYNLTRSLRFRSSASAYLTRTPASAGNRKTYTFSTWVKRGSLTSYQKIFGDEDTGEANGFQIQFRNDDTLQVYDYTTSVQWDKRTTPVYRDPSAWYHIVVAVDTTQATASNRVKIYVNGLQITSFSVNTDPSLNADTQLNRTVAHSIGRSGTFNGAYFDGYLTEINFVDGQALTPSSFGANSATTGVWQPKKYVGTYGTQGFYLPFTDNSGATSTTIGKDFSGNSNNWTPNNISVTAGSTYDSMTDVPTLTSATAANYCVLNPLSATGSPTISNANLTFDGGATSIIRGTIGGTGFKFYYEIVSGTTASPASPLIFAIANIEGLPAAHDNWKQAAYLYSDASSGALNHYQNGSLVQSITLPVSLRAITSGNILQVAYDGVTGKVWLGVNNVWADNSGGTTGNPSSGTNQTFTFTDTSIPMTPTKEHAGVAWTGSLNCGQRPFTYTPPTGFVALNTFNLPTPTIGATASTQANKYFDINLWTGNDTSQTITNSGGFQPDFVWIKSRSTASSNSLQDVLRGTNLVLFSDATDADTSATTRLTSFNSNGFSLGSNTSVNGSGNSHVGWQWKANGTGVTNTAGSITSTVSANTSAGFSVVTYTGNGINGATVGHGLGVTPSFVIMKSRSLTGSSPSSSWICWHQSISQAIQTSSTIQLTGYTGGIYLNLTAASGTYGMDAQINGSGQTYVAYCFSEVAGYSKFGSYTGNGSTDGTFVYTGFRPRYVMFKRTNTTEEWAIYDTSRDTYNVAETELFANSSSADYDGNRGIDFLSNGIKLRSAGGANNASGSTYIYMAFAESPFKYANAR